MQELENQHEITLSILKEKKQKENETQNHCIVKSDIELKDGLERNITEKTPLIKKKKAYRNIK